jgi:hypothetical protein
MGMPSRTMPMVVVVIGLVVALALLVGLGRPATLLRARGEPVPAVLTAVGPTPPRLLCYDVGRLDVAYNWTDTAAIARDEIDMSRAAEQAGGVWPGEATALDNAIASGSDATPEFLEMLIGCRKTDPPPPTPGSRAAERPGERHSTENSTKARPTTSRVRRRRETISGSHTRHSVRADSDEAVDRRPRSALGTDVLTT